MIEREFREAPEYWGCGEGAWPEDRRALFAAWCAFMERLCSCTRLIITISLASDPCAPDTPSSSSEMDL